MRCGKKLYANPEGSYMFHCPGCGMLHIVHVEKPNGAGAQWTFNRSGDTPTFSPSILVTWQRQIDGEWRDMICHSFVREGMIQFCDDSTHKLAGHTVELPNWED